MFRDLPPADFVQLEQDVLTLWRERAIFRKSVERPATQGDYVFYEGPPTANGKPGVHHVISRAYKDLFPRFKTMQGYRVGRKGGWDTHGLPVELEVEKKLGFTRKSQIDEFGIAKFNELCKQSAFEYIQEWNAMTERIGFWVDLDEAYITYDNRYIESCWWLMKSLWERGLLVEDYKSTWHCPRNNTSLASHEVSLGYREDVEDPSVYPKFPADSEALRARGLLPAVPADAPVYIMAWTTTPWTLAANTALAVNAEANYSLVKAATRYGEAEQPSYYILAEALLEAVFGEGNYELLHSFSGDSLRGVPYRPILQAHIPADEDPSRGFYVLTDPSVSLEDGTGVLHIAPAYGDLEIGRANNLPTLFSVDLLGHVHPEVKLWGAAEGDGPYTGMFFKDADAHISRDLLEQGWLFHVSSIRHTYPFNWRDGTPLLNYAKKSWYIRTTAVREALVANNQAINWYPEHIRDGRFGNWLENNIDWALSRERYWGAPLPIWVAEDGSEHLCIGSVAELEQRCGRDLSDLELHRPYVDDISFEKDGKTFRRVPYTVDVWFESGAMPYAQWHYMGNSSDEATQQQLAHNFPADYICEAIDQTRGWFYSLHALATLLSDSGNAAAGRPPGALAHLAENTSAFKHVICLGHILDENGEKMSKSKGNAVDPWSVLNAQGADALRWYLYSASPPGNSKRFSQALVDECLRDFFMTLWNSYSFFVLYANLDKPDLQQHVAVAERPAIDRWLLAKVHSLIAEVTELLEHYDPTAASRAIRNFVVDDLSNWYIRRNRRRFWKSESDSDKLAVYQSLYEALVNVSLLMAPLAPFFSESMYQNLVLSLQPDAPESVHLAQWPTPKPEYIDEALLEDMAVLVRVVELGRAARAASKVKVRQPLPEVLVRVRSDREQAGLQRLEAQLLEELNVKAVRYLSVSDDFVDYSIKPNLPRVGKRLGKRIPELKKQLGEADGKAIARAVRDQTSIHMTLGGEEYSFAPEDFLIEARSPEGYAAVEDKGYLAALNTQLSPELIEEGLARDVIRLVQNARKNAGLAVSDTIVLGLQLPTALEQAVRQHQPSIMREVLAEALQLQTLADAAYQEALELDEHQGIISLKKAQAVPTS